MPGSKTWQERRWRRAGLNALGLRMHEYDRYLETAYWQEFRERIVAGQRRIHGHNFCEKCSASDHPLHVHHETYERLGKELPADVSIICEPCHDKLHLRDPQSQKRNYAPGRR